MKEKQQEKSPIKQNILLYLEKKGVTPYEFYKESGVTRGILQQNNGISEDNIARFLAYAPDVNIEWLLTSKGTMLKDDLNGIQTANNSTPAVMSATSDDASADTPGTAHAPEAVTVSISQKEKQTMKPIPLVTETVVAGFGNCDFAIAEQDVKDYYVIPKFRYSRVDFMIEVSGLSMHPHFNPGDIIACTILTDRKFLQWNKCHVIATREQGILVKRLMPSKQKNCLTAISDNKDYPPFDIPLDEITGIALVVGSVSLE